MIELQRRRASRALFDLASTYLTRMLLAVLILSGCGGGDPAEVQSRVVVPKEFAEIPSSVVGSNSVGIPGSAREQPREAQAVDAPTGFTGTGWYWNPNEGGTGFFIEAQGKSAFVGIFVYDEKGSPTWVAGLGTIQSDVGGYLYSGRVKRYSGGQPAESSANSAPNSSDVGNIHITFRGDGVQTTATVDFPGGRTMTARRFSFDVAGPQTYTYGSDFLPETGWYWNPSNAGQGWAFEMQGDSVFMVMYHYRPDGSPTWNIVQGKAFGSSLKSGFKTYSGGQMLAGPYRAPISVPTNVTYTLSEMSQCAIKVTYPGLATVALTRFRFGNIPENSECRAKYAPSLAAPDAGSTAGLGAGLEGFWYSGSEFGIVGPDGRTYFYSRKTTSFGSFQSSWNAWANGTVRADGGKWAMTEARAFTTNSAMKSNLSGGGALSVGRSLSGLVDGILYAYAYSPNNARAVAQESLQGLWRSSGAELSISKFGAVSGSSYSNSLGYCRLTGQITQTTPNSLKNAFTVNIYGSNTATGSQKSCELTSPRSGLGAIVREYPTTSSRTYVDKFKTIAWSSDDAWAAEFFRQ